MRYLLRPHLFAVTDTFVVRNGADQEVFQVQPGRGGPRNELRLADASGQVRGVIREFSPDRNKAWFEIYRSGELALAVRPTAFTRFNCRFHDGTGERITAAGDFLNYEYTLNREGEVMAVVSTRLNPAGFGVEIAGNEDPVVVLAGAIVLDALAEQRYHRPVS